MAGYTRPDDPGREPLATPASRRSLEVTVDDRGVESALRAFKRLVQRDGLLRELRRRQSYEKPGERKRRKVREAARRRRRQLSRALRRMTERG
ncbi:MAG TPA: 30S ribosomal protein S21 [Candidatus Methylomirabilis sp.]|nr:30S ribosomal protein S21 [Candidatus Methylomirabilis sp.]